MIVFYNSNNWQLHEILISRISGYVSVAFLIGSFPARVAVVSFLSGAK